MAPAEKSIGQMMDRLEGLRAQKAELERQEQALVKEIREQLEKQGDRARQLGIGTKAASGPAAPTAVAPGIPPQGSLTAGASDCSAGICDLLESRRKSRHELVTVP